jgi:hypothetical protein
MNWLKNAVGGAIDASRGRHTLFALLFFTSGNLMQWFHRLDGVYITYMSLLMTAVLAHSTQENYFDKDKPRDANCGK